MKYKMLSCHIVILGFSEMIYFLEKIFRIFRIHRFGINVCFPRDPPRSQSKERIPANRASGYVIIFCS